jgi:putative hemolysin
MEKVRSTRHSRYILSNGSVEHIVGVIVLKDLILQVSEGKLNLAAIAKKPLYIPESASILDALEKFKTTTDAMALIVDEYGSLEGVVTLKDVMEAIVGTLPEPKHREDYDAVQREDGSWLVDGGFTTSNAEETIGIKIASADDDYTTIAGFVIHHLRDIPKTGQILKWNGWKFEVVDMDGRRVDKILVSKS